MSEDVLAALLKEKKGKEKFKKPGETESVGTFLNKNWQKHKGRGMHDLIGD